jgi:hypothetical protein
VKNALYPLYSVARLLGRVRQKKGQTGMRAAHRNRNTRGVPGGPRRADGRDAEERPTPTGTQRIRFCVKLPE